LTKVADVNDILGDLTRRALAREPIPRDAALRLLAGDDELLDVVAAPANSIFLGDYPTSEGQPGADDRQMIADAGFTIEGAEEQSLPDARHDLVVLRRRGAGTDLPANA
jgi:hypothetical protein